MLRTIRNAVLGALLLSVGCSQPPATPTGAPPAAPTATGLAAPAGPTPQPTATLNRLQAAVLAVKLPRLEAWNEQRRANAALEE